VHWANGGATSLGNLVLLCRRHHRLLHEGGYNMRPETGREFTFINAAGRIVEVAPAAPRWSRVESVDLTASWLCDLPEDTRGRPTTATTWDGTRFDLGYVVNALRGHEPLRSLPAQEQ
jgi:hypothetical protein